MAVFQRTVFPGQRSNMIFETALLAGDPGLNIGWSEAPKLPHANAVNVSAPRQFLEGLRMNLHHSRGLDGIEQ
jgi:hypothetical protein